MAQLKTICQVLGVDTNVVGVVDEEDGEEGAGRLSLDKLPLGGRAGGSGLPLEGSLA